MFLFTFGVNANFRLKSPPRWISPLRCSSLLVQKSTTSSRVPPRSHHSVPLYRAFTSPLPLIKIVFTPRLQTPSHTTAPFILAKATRHYRVIIGFILAFFFAVEKKRREESWKLNFTKINYVANHSHASSSFAFFLVEGFQEDFLQPSSSNSLSIIFFEKLIIFLLHCARTFHFMNFWRLSARVQIF